MEAISGISSKGKQTIIYRNFEYVKHRNNGNGTSAWRCRYFQSLKCKARLVTAGTHIVSNRQPDHSHEGNISNSLARKAVGEMKTRMADMTVTPSAARASVSVDLNDNVLMALPERSLLSRTLQRERHRLAVAANGIPMPAVPTDLLFDIPDRFADVILYDSGPGDDRMLLIGCPELLDGLARANTWIADGTFKVVPSVFFQLYSIHFNFADGVNPAGVYCLLINKTTETYRRLLDQLRVLIPAAAPQKILVDFERAAMNEFSTAYPNATVSGCYFHLCQSILRKVNEIGLKTDYENDDNVRQYIRCLPALAFVPPEDVDEAFDILADSMPQDVHHLDELTTFFEHTYVRGRRQRGRGHNFGPALFPVQNWNQHAAGVSGIARTTNAVEGWHHALQSLYSCHHPTVWTFLTGIKKDMQLQKTVYLQGTAGVTHVSGRKYRQLNARVIRAVAAYGQSEILLYLRSIAYLSHS